MNHWIVFFNLITFVFGSCNIYDHCLLHEQDLQCTISNPQLKLKTKQQCPSNLTMITFKIDNIKTFDEFFSNNLETVKSFYELFEKTCNGCIINIELINFTSKSNYIIQISINNEWISKIIREDVLIIDDSILSINIIDKDWTKLNLTINQEINSIIWTFKSLRLFLSDSQSNCSIQYRYIMSEIKDNLSPTCSKFIKIINDSTFTYSDLDTSEATSSTSTATITTSTITTSIITTTVILIEELSSNKFPIIYIILPIAVIIFIGIILKLKRHCVR